MPNPNLDTRDAEGTYASKANIVPATASPPAGSTQAANAAEAPLTTSGNVVRRYARQSATGADALVTRPLQTFSDSSTIAAQAVDTGALGAGVVDAVAVLSQGGAGVAQKGLVVAHRNAADNADLSVLGFAPAGADKSVIEVRGLVVGAGERIVVRQSAVVSTGLSDVRLTVSKVS